MQETQVRSLGWEDPLEKKMATHSSTLAWKIPWTEEPGRLQSWGCKESDTTKQLHFSTDIIAVDQWERHRCRSNLWMMTPDQTKTNDIWRKSLENHWKTESLAHSNTMGMETMKRPARFCSLGFWRRCWARRLERRWGLGHKGLRPLGTLASASHLPQRPRMSYFLPHSPQFRQAS